MNLGAELRAARKSAGLSQDALGKAAGVSSRTIRTIEAGGGRMATITAVMAVLKYRVSGLSAGATLAAQIANRRRVLGWTQGRLADQAGVSVPTVRAAERGRASAATLSAIIKVIGREPRRRAEERAHWSPDPTGERDSQFTPPELIAKIIEAFGEIDLDPCGHPEAFVPAKRIICRDEDGLATRWSGRLAYMNCPYSELLVWVRRAHRAWRDREVETVIALMPTRTDSGDFHETIFGVADVVLLRGRQRFFLPGGRRGHQLPTSLMLVCWGADDAQVQRFTELVPSAWIPKRGTSEAA